VNGIALLLHNDMDAYRLVQLDAVVVDEALRLEAAIRPFPHHRAHRGLRDLQQAGGAGEGCRLSGPGGEARPAPLAPPIGARRAANVAEPQVGRTAVGGDDALEIAVGNMARLVAHRGKLQALVEDFARLARATARNRSADVALVRDAAAESDQLAFDYDRRYHGDVG